MSADFDAWFELYPPDGLIDDALRAVGLNPRQAGETAILFSARQSKELEIVQILTWAMLCGMGAALAPGPNQVDLTQAARDLASLIEEHQSPEAAGLMLTSRKDRMQARQVAADLVDQEELAPLAAESLFLGMALGELAKRQ